MSASDHPPSTIHHPPVRLSSDAITPHLSTRWAGRSLLCFNQVGSTNTVAAERARAGAAHGTTVIAESQTGGRGRLGRTWASPRLRNLYMSIVLRPDFPAERLSWVSLMAGVAVRDAVAEVCPAQIKWPNDVLVGERKVAGILVEMEGERAARFLIVGIGVNLNARLEDFPPELRQKAGSLQMATGAPIDRPRFVGRLLGELERRYEQLRDEGVAPIASAWHAHAAFLNQAVTVSEPGGGTVSGVALGLDESGALRMRLASGEERRLLAGDVEGR